MVDDITNAMGFAVGTAITVGGASLAMNQLHQMSKMGQSKSRVRKARRRRKR